MMKKRREKDLKADGGEKKRKSRRGVTREGV